MYTKSITTLLLVLSFSSTLCAQKNSEFQTGHLLKIESVAVSTVTGANPFKASYLLQLREGNNGYYGLYKVSSFGHDYAKSLKAGVDIPFRISGNNLILKTPEGHEIKTRLCERAGNATRCGSDSFSDIN
jgi:hypothetical protein